MSDDGRGRAALDPDAVYLGLSLETWVKVGVLAPLFIAVYWLVLRWLWDKTNPIWGEANWGHAICIPIVGLYYLYINRDELLRQPVEPLVMGPLKAWHRLYPAVAMMVIGGIAWGLVKAGAVADAERLRQRRRQGAARVRHPAAARWTGRWPACCSD
jgi:hypothetical protein